MGITEEDEGFTYLMEALGEPSPVRLHFSMFIPTLNVEATEEQAAYWLPLARSFKIIGTYAQTG